MHSLGNMTKIWLCSIFLLALIILAWFMRPTELMAKTHPLILTQVFPETFGDWRVDDSIMPLEVSPELQAKLDKTYDQTLSRTYINSQGYRIMLSVAYGGNQSSDSTQVHRPEFCYTAQGFSISDAVDAQLIIDGHYLPIRKLVARLRDRNEPISYWITIGNTATQPGIQRKLTQLGYGISGKVPDGFLVRISSIDSNSNYAYDKQKQFIQDFFAVMPASERERIFGITQN